MEEPASSISVSVCTRLPVRTAYQSAAEQGTVGPRIHALAQSALHTGKRVHTETEIDEAGSSMVSFEVLRRVHSDDAFANLTLHKALRVHKLEGRDAAFATELTSGSLRTPSVRKEP